MDGTFDQMKPLSRLQDKFSRVNIRGKKFYSIDLSAATDRLPVDIQVTFLAEMLRGIVPDSYEFAKTWKDLAVNRPFKVSLSKKLKESVDYDIKTLPADVYYATGQGMGMLYSWASLALVHHAIIQYSSFRAGYKH